MKKTESSVRKRAHEAQLNRTRNNWALQCGQDRGKDDLQAKASSFNTDDELELLRLHRNLRG